MNCALKLQVQERAALVEKGLIGPVEPLRPHESRARYVLRQIKVEILFLEACRRALPDSANKDKIDGAMFAYQRVQDLLRIGGI